MSLRPSTSSRRSSADDELEDKLPRVAEREIQENSSAAKSPQRQRQPTTGCCLGVARRSPSDSTSPTRRSPATCPHRRGHASSDAVGASRSAPRVAARTCSEEEARPERDREAKIKEGADGQEQGPFAKMAYGTEELPNPPKKLLEPINRSYQATARRWRKRGGIIIAVLLFTAYIPAAGGFRTFEDLDMAAEALHTHPYRDQLLDQVPLPPAEARSCFDLICWWLAILLTTTAACLVVADRIVRILQEPQEVLPRRGPAPDSETPLAVSVFVSVFAVAVIAVTARALFR